MLLFLNKSSSAQLALQDGFRAAAGAFRGEVRRSHGRDVWGGGNGIPQLQCYPSPAQVLFVVVDVTGFGADVLPFFGLTPADAPTLRLVKMENNRKYRMDQDTFSDTAIRTFIQDLEGEAAQVFYEVASELVDVPFGVAKAAELFQAYGLSADTVCLFKKFDEGRTDFPVDPARGLDAAELTRLLRVHSLELVMEFTNETSDEIFSAKIPHHMLLFLNKSSSAQLALQDGFRAAAGAFRGEVLFVVVDVTGFGADVLPFFGLTPADAPTLRLVKMENNRKYRMDQDTFSDTAIRTFIQAVLDGKVKPHLMSAEPPEDWDTRPVKVLVGKTFEQVAFDETKNVFVKFYAPWCSHCQAMAAAWEELGERYKDHEDIVIAELDSTANELENITINGFPTLHYFPAGPGRKVDVETFSKFLENGGTLPEEPPAVSEVPHTRGPGLHSHVPAQGKKSPKQGSS
uniref:protein disulfide-isomerase n=1 Tax=Bubo bubo TaxID=30461 RepID=A0A8C0F477_BUBBB